MLSQTYSDTTCHYCGCRFLLPERPCRSRSCPNCNITQQRFAKTQSARPKWFTSKFLLMLSLTLLMIFSGCDKDAYNRGYKKGYSDGYYAGKIAGFAAGTANFVKGTIIPNLGLVVSALILFSAASWLSINYIAPRHRAKKAEYDAQHSVEKTREQLQLKTDVAVRSEIDRLQANLVLEKHEHLIRGKLEEFYANATLLLLNESMNVVNQLCDLHLRTVSEIASASDLSSEERVLLFPAVTEQLSTVSKRIHSDA